MKFTLKELKLTIRNTLVEAMGAVKMLDVVHARLILSKEKKIEEILTAIRIIKGVATVNQSSPVQQHPNGSRYLDIFITFDPGDNDQFEYIDALARIMKKIPDVTMIVFKTLNDRPIRDASGKKKLVY